MVNGLSRPIREAVGRLLLDSETARLVAVLDERGIPAILLKGPAISQWLYAPGDRAYVDIDLLIPPALVERAGETLRTIGYSRRIDVAATDLSHDRATYAFGWRHPRGILVEIHQTLVGVSARPEHAWYLLSQSPTTVSVAGRDVPALGIPARLLHLALHAAQNGRGGRKSLEDLRRGIELVEVTRWMEASRLAEELAATAAFSTGLYLLPEGERLAKQLGIAPSKSVAVELHAAGSRSSARSLEWFRHLSRRQKAAWLWGKLFPPPTFMRLWNPLARRSQLGLVIAYLWRPFWILKEAVLGGHEWIKMRRSLRTR